MSVVAVEKPGTEAGRRRRRTGRAELLMLAVGVLIAVVPWLGLDALWVREAEMTVIFTLIVTGLNLSHGWAGELSFAQPALFAFGAYSTALLSTHGFNDLLLNLVVAGVIAALAGTIVGIPGLRLSSWSLAMVSFFLVLLIPDLVTITQDQTGGQAGFSGIPLPMLFGGELSENTFFVIAVVVCAVWLGFFRNLVRSRHGAAMRILATNTVLAESAGIQVGRLKLVSYLLGALPAGFAGVLYAYLNGFIMPADFGFTVGIGILAASVLGGTRSIYAAILSTAVLQIITLESASFSDYSLLIYGGLLLLGGLVFRQGIGEALTRLGHRFRRGHPDAARERARAEVSHADIDTYLRPHATADPLVVEDVARTFGGVRALDGVSLVAEPGQVCALIGPNGSGKTTLLNVMSGFYPPTAGTVRCGDQVLEDGRAWRSARFGVARTFQTPTIPAGMTVLEVVASARYRLEYVGMLRSVLRLKGFRTVRRRDEQAAWAALRFVGIDDVAHAEAAALPLGLRRRVEVARAVVMRPRIILLDEPASGLSETEVGQFGRLLNEIKRMGVIVVLVEHNFPFVLSVADRVVALDFGAVMVSGTPAEIRDSERLRERYLGHRQAVTAAHGASPSTSDARLLLEVTRLASGYGDLRAVWDVDLTVCEGQTTVLLGSNGAGKTTTLMAIAGLLPAMAGDIGYLGKPLGRGSASRRTRAGLALVQEGKRVFRALTVEQNLLLGGWTTAGRTRAKLGRRAEEMFERFPALAEKRHARAGSLSGGQQQILAIAQALMPAPKLLMLDEPSAGLAPAIMEDVLRAIRELNADGIGVLLVEQLVDTALSVADRVVVVSQGRTTLRVDDRGGIGDGSAIRAAYDLLDEPGMKVPRNG